MMKGHIFLIGFMGCGKSTVARHLAAKLDCPYSDTDAMIEAKAGMTISEIFEKEGEPAFREMETALLRTLKGQRPMIISCGGGMAMRPENAALMKEAGTVVLIKASPETILERVVRNDNRPLLRGRKDIPSISALMEERRPRYEAAADFYVMTDNERRADEVAEEIIDKMKQTGDKPAP